jgi:phage-related minor tail protein
MAKGDEITTRFSVDISDLKKGISEANQQIKLANAEFKAATAGMDDWASSADGIRAKLSQLESTLDAQKKRLAAYTEELDRNERAYEQNGQRASELRAALQELADKGVDKNSQEYKKLQNALEATEREQEKNRTAADKLKITVLEQQAAVNKTDAEIGKYNKSLDELENEQGETASSTDKLNDKLDDTDAAAAGASDGFTVMGGVMAGVLVEAIKAAITALKELTAAAYEAWQSFDEGADNIIAATGAQGDALEDLTDAYKRTASSVVGDFAEIGTAIGEVNTRFGSTGSQLSSLSTKFLKFASLNGTNVKSSIDDVQSALAAFGLGADEAGAFLDTLNKAGQDTGVSLSTLIGQIKSNSSSLQEMGYSISQSAFFLANLEKNGIDASSVLSGLKKATSQAAKDGIPLTNAIDELTASIKNAETSTEAITAATELFGARSAAAIAKAVQDGRLSFDEMSVALHDFDGNIEDTYERMQDAPDRIALAMQNVRLVTADVLGEFLDKYAPQIEAALDGFLNDVLPEIVSGLEAFFAFIEPAVSKLVEIVNAAIPVIQEVWDYFAPYFKAIFDEVVSVVQTLAPYISDALKAAWQLIQAIWERAVPFFSAIWETIKSIFAVVAAVFSGDFEEAGKQIRKTVDKWVDYFKLIWEDIKKVFSVVASWFGSVFGKAWETIKEKFASWASFWKGLWDKVTSTFVQIGQTIGNAIEGAIKGAINQALSFVENSLNNVIKLVNGVIAVLNLLGAGIPDIGLVSLPRLAKGGILAKGQVGLLEGSGAEAVVPLDENKAWISAVAADMVRALGASPAGASADPGAAADGFSFTQVINSPQPLTRIEIYRQTRNLLQLAHDTGGI